MTDPHRADPETVRALRIHRAGDLRLDRVPRPVATAGETLVRLRYGGICGSDVHYWRDGAVGTSVLRAPMILGHEIVGTVAATAADGSGPALGEAVAVHPARTCGACRWCREGRPNLCFRLRYLGSAGRWPHTDGGFVEQMAIPADRLVPVPAGLSLRRAALAEPATVAWHAVGRAAALADRFSGSRALVIGAGPIGQLVTAAVMDRGAGEAVVVDVHDRPLRIARQVGAERTLTAAELQALEDPLGVDIAFESSGSIAGLSTALSQTRPGGTVIIVGQLPRGELPVPAGLIVASELTVAGSLRIGDELPDALAFIARAGAALDPLLTEVMPLGDAMKAFELAADPARSTKVLLELSPPGDA